MEAIRFEVATGELHVLDQLLLPHETTYIAVTSAHDGHRVVRDMNVRGAPALAITAALSLAAELRRLDVATATLESPADVFRLIEERWAFLVTARPTAVNLDDARRSLVAQCRAFLLATASTAATAQDMIDFYCEAANAFFLQDVQANLALAGHGARWLLNRLAAESTTSSDEELRVLTHCNTGALATSGHGTALGMIRTLHSIIASPENTSKLTSIHAFNTETRPYNQGSRLTAYELLHSGIPATLIADSAVEALLSSRRIHAVIVGADRVTRRGDTINKIGTAVLARVAKAHNVPFIVCAPTTSIDVSMDHGKEVTIEERSDAELTCAVGLLSDGSGFAKVKVAPHGVRVWNPAFDVTPAELVTAIVSERGVIEAAVDTGVYDLKTFVA